MKTININIHQDIDMAEIREEFAIIKDMIAVVRRKVDTAMGRFDEIEATLANIVNNVTALEVAVSSENINGLTPDQAAAVAAAISDVDARLAVVVSELPAPPPVA